MGFLDNLESNLKNLESQEERGSANSNRREADRVLALGVAPWAEKLRSGLFTQRLLEEAALKGHELRAKIYVAWLDQNLRLELRGNCVEMRPTPNGIVAHYFKPDGIEIRAEKLDLSGVPGKFLDAWIASQPAPTLPTIDEQAS